MTDPVLLTQLKAKSIEQKKKNEIPLDLAKLRYGGHFQTVLTDLATVEHTSGEVKRTIFLRRDLADGGFKRLMLTLSDTHLVINDVTAPAAPTASSPPIFIVRARFASITLHRNPTCRASRRHVLAR